jgi:hypothetical protein
MTLTSPLKSEISGNSVIRKRSGAGGRYEIVRANGADLFLGALVTFKGETASDPDVDLSATGEPVNGVIVGPAYDALDLDKDSDDCYADNTWLIMYVPAPGDELYLTMATNTAGTYGEWVTHSGGFVNGDFSYADGSADTDTMQDVIGSLQETISAATGVEKVCLVRWGSP